MYHVVTNFKIIQSVIAVRCKQRSNNTVYIFYEIIIVILGTTLITGITF